MYCKNFKIKLNQKRWCNLLDKEIKIGDCNSCKYKEYDIKISNSHQIKKRTYKLVKTERNRYSLFTDDLNHCIICGKSPVNKHEIFYGRNRQNSIKYGLVIPLCVEEHHNQIEHKGIHFDKELCDYWHKKGQLAFIGSYPNLDFLDIFKRNYL